MKRRGKRGADPVEIGGPIEWDFGNSPDDWGDSPATGRPPTRRSPTTVYGAAALAVIVLVGALVGVLRSTPEREARVATGPAPTTTATPTPEPTLVPEVEVLAPLSVHVAIAAGPDLICQLGEVDDIKGAACSTAGGDGGRQVFADAGGAPITRTVASQGVFEQINRVAPKGHMLYQSTDGLVIVDFATGDAHLVAEIGEALVNNADVLFGQSDQQWAVDMDSGLASDIGPSADVTFVTGSAFTINMLPPGEVYGSPVSDASLTDGLVRVMNGAQVGDRVPIDRSTTNLKGVPGLGVLVVGQEDTLLLDRTGLHVLVVGARPIAASVGATLFERCGDNGCFYELLNHGTGEATPLNVNADFYERWFSNAAISVSPDGSLIYRFADGSGSLYEPETDNSQWITRDAARQAAWMPDSSLIGWIDLSDTPELQVVGTGQRVWIALRFDQAGLPAPVSSQVIFTQD